MKNLDDLLSQINPELSAVIKSITQTGVAINQLLQRGALADILGAAGNENVQGEEQKKLDVLSNDMLIESLREVTHCAGMASEEMDAILQGNVDGQYLVTFDPLDGSSNIDINMAVGTIFSILPRQTQQGTETTEKEFLQAGTQQVAAGYILYGPSTMLALTTGNGTHLFTLDPETGNYLLTTENVNISPTTSEFAINMSNQRHWEQPMQDYIAECLAGETGIRGKNYNMRWVAAMVGDVHRILCRGGLFTYPFDTKDPKKPGKLRLMYEANPMSMLIEQAGGESTTARQRIMDIAPEQLHQRVPVVLGSSDEVQRIASLHLAFDKN